MKPFTLCSHAALIAFLAALLAPVSSALTISDNFTDPANWGAPLTEAGGNLSVGSGRMNYTATSNSNSFAATLRTAPLLPTTQDWSLKVDAHLNPFTLTTDGQFSDVFLGFGKTGDWINTHVTFEFGRGYWGNPSKKGYYISDDTRINGSDAPTLFSNWNVTSADVALRMDYSAASHTLTYYFDSDGAVGGYNWVAQGSANLASGTYNLNLGATDTFTVLLVGSSAGQTVAAGQACLSNLEITINQSPIVTTGTASGITATSATLNGTVNPNGLATSAQFEYGLTTTYGSKVSVTLSPINSSTAQAVTASLGALQSGATYHFRLTAFNNGGSGLGGDATFTAPAMPFTYMISNGTITITGYNGPGGAVTIPSAINDLPVTAIGDWAFRDLGLLTSVEIPNSVIRIGSGSFYNCTGLAGVTIPVGLASIGDSAFLGCGKISNVTLPTNLTSIGEAVFYSCTSLENITIPNSVTSIGRSAFASCASLANIVIPNSVTSIESNAFDSCISLASVSIPSSVTSIGSSAFSSCTSLASVSIPNSVTSIGSNAFSSCTSLASASIPNAITSIKAGTFSSCTSLASITIPSSVTSIGMGAFSSCTSLANITIPDSVTSIGDRAFSACSNLTIIAIPESVTSIGFFQFLDCTRLAAILVDTNNPSYNSFDGVLFNKDLTSLISCPEGKVGDFTIPESVTSINYNAFKSCTSLTKVTISSSVTTIEDYAFYNCASLEAMTIPASVTRIGDNAFDYCEMLACFYFQGNAPSLGSDVFYALSSPVAYYLPGTVGWSAYYGGIWTILWDGNVLFHYTTSNGEVTITGYIGHTHILRLVSVDIPETINGLPVTRIANQAFLHASRIDAVSIPDSVRSIDYRAFYYCENLARVTIGKGVTSIASSAFELGPNLTGVYFQGNAPSVGPDVFLYDSNVIVYYLPGTSGWGATLGGRPTVMLIAPTVTTGPASEIATSSAILQGSVNPNGFVTSAQFEYGLTNAYGSAMSVTLSPNNGTSVQNVSASISGLKPGQVYHYRLIATNPGTNGTGNDMAFETIALPFTYTINNSAVTITGYTGPGGVVVIPETIDGLPVVGIGNEAFRYHASITSVSIPNSVTSIGDGAFAECDRLAGFTIPASVTNIGYGVFDDCYGMLSITVNPASPNYSSLDGVLFNKAKTTLIQWPAGRYGPYTIPGSVTRIEDFAFEGCNSLTSVSIPSSVTHIGFEAFHDCWGLTSVIIPASVESIGSSAFADLSGALAITVDAANPKFSSADGVLFDKLKTALIQYPAGKVGSYSIPVGVISIGQEAFSECRRLTSVTIPTGVTSIGGSAFGDCIELTGVTIPASVTEIGQGPFEGCISQSSISVDDANIVFSSADGVLFDKLKTLLIQYPCGKSGAYTIPASVTDVGPDAFSGCRGLKSVTIPASVTNIGDPAFEECAELAAISVDAANPNYSSADGVLYDKFKTILIAYPGGKLGDYTIPASVLNIGDSPFEECSGLTSITVDTANPNYSSENGVLFDKLKTTLMRYPSAKVGAYTIPSSITNVDENAFYQCNELTSLTIPACVLEIGEFEGCGALTEFVVDAVNPSFSTVDGVLFNKLEDILLQYPAGKVGAYTIPTGIIRIDAWSFESCSGLTSVNIPASVTSIGEEAFYECGGLTSAVFSGNAPLMSYGVFDPTAPGFTVYYFNGAAGFTSPTWMGYPSVNMGDASPVVNWLLARGFPYNADMESDPNSDGVSLLMAYALNLDPNQNLAGSMPRPVIAGNQMSLIFYAGSEGVIYTVETSTDLKAWSTTGVTVSAPDVNQFRTATVSMSGPICFMRIGVFEGVISPAASWLIANGFSGTENLLEDPNGDGVNLLTAYALNLDPKLNLSGSMPKPLIAGNQMSLNYFAGNGDVIYTVETSTDLQFWTTDGVLISASDTNGFRTAAVPTAGPSRFMRLVLVY